MNQLKKLLAVLACGCLLTAMAVERAELVWSARQSSDEAWEAALENLRGLGCARLYHLREAMDSLRVEDAVQQRQRVRTQLRPLVSAHSVHWFSLLCISITQATRFVFQFPRITSFLTHILY